MADAARRSLWYALIFSAVSLAGGVGLMLYFGRDLPSFDQLERVRPKLTTTVYGVEGSALKEFAEQKRDVIPFDKIPPHLIEALVATEDRQFWDHWGINLRGIARAIWTDVRTLSFRQGASTITQQLARNLFPGQLTLDVSLSRKTKEAITAVLLERTYTKQEILAMYLNQVYFGHSAWGLQSAAKAFFSKDAKDLTLEESALIVALLKAPISYSPTDHPQKALERRNIVLGAMADFRRISPAEVQAAKKRPLGLKPRKEEAGAAPYFVEHVRRLLEGDPQFGAQAIYEKGLSVYTTLDPRVQRAAEEALLPKLAELQKDFDRQHRFDRPRPGEAPRIIQGGLVALDREGHILAMIGGRDFEESQFNRAVQALRQPGSAFKPFVYTAAIDNGYTPIYRVLDTAISIPQADGTIWTPENYDHTFMGSIPLRRALALSRNLATIRLLMEIGPQTVVQHARAMGITSPLDPIPSLALGTNEVGLLEITAAYAVFPNEGVWAEPTAILRIEDKDGNVLREQKKGAERFVLNEATAAVMTGMLRSVIDEGTGKGAALWGFGRGSKLEIVRPAGGKTGTTGNYADAWFIGFTPQIVSGVWIGFDEKVSLGERLTASVIAVPVWAKFMHDAHRALRLPPRDFKLPAGVITLPVCSESYQIATSYCPYKYDEVFVGGTQPTETCALHPQAASRGPAIREGRRLQF